MFLAVPDTDTMVQATFEIPEGKSFSRVTAVTAQEGGSPVIGVTTEPGGAARITVDGDPYLGGSGFLTGGVELQITGAKEVKILFDSGVEVYAEVQGYKNMPLCAFVLPTMDTRGLLGNNNRDATDEEISEYCAVPETVPEIPDDLPSDVAEV